MGLIFEEGNRKRQSIITRSVNVRVIKHLRLSTEFVFCLEMKNKQVKSKKQQHFVIGFDGVRRKQLTLFTFDVYVCFTIHDLFSLILQDTCFLKMDLEVTVNDYCCFVER